MSIVDADLKVYRSASVSDSSSNGGRMGITPIASAVSGNIFPNVSSVERAAGSDKFRKVFFKNENSGGLTLYNSMIYMDSNTPGDDRQRFKIGSSTDTQGAITGPRFYGTGLLSSNALSSATSISVTVEDGAVELFKNGDKVRITNKATPDSLVGDEAFVTVSGVPTVVGSVVTIPITPLPTGFSSGAKVSSVYEAGDIVASSTTPSVASAGGTIDESQIVLSNKATILQTWTLTFTDSTHFTISGDQLGTVGTGTVSAGASYFNAAMSDYAFSIPNTAFGGVWLAGDYVVFTTHEAAKAIWVERVVPAGSGVQSSNSSRFVLTGETA